MEFYENALVEWGVPYKLFQFPTGWNSTKMVLKRTGFNLLRFNSQRDGILHIAEKKHKTAKESFNSQRDGILQSKVKITVLETNCFNSQRDGILPK